MTRNSVKRLCLTFCLQQRHRQIWPSLYIDTHRALSPATVPMRVIHGNLPEPGFHARFRSVRRAFDRLGSRFIGKSTSRRTLLRLLTKTSRFFKMKFYTWIAFSCILKSLPTFLRRILKEALTRSPEMRPFTQESRHLMLHLASTRSSWFRKKLLFELTLTSFSLLAEAHTCLCLRGRIHCFLWHLLRCIS